MSQVVITHNQNIGTAIAAALQHIDLRPLVEGRLVAVKVNETWASGEDTSGVTQPDTLRAVLDAVRQFQPRELVVTGGAGAAETDDVFRIAGLMDVVQEAGATFFDHNRAPFVSVDLSDEPGADVRSPQQSVMINPRILDYETLIAVNQLKLHATATVTMALKNIAMSFPAADYYGHPRSKEKHEHAFFDDMHSFIAVMARRFSIDLALTVGHPAMIGTGPLGGHTFETGLAIASTDALAADVAGARLLGFQVQAVRHLWEARRLGLGQTDLVAIDFPVLSMKEAIGIFTKAAYGKELDFKHA